MRTWGVVLPKGQLIYSWILGQGLVGEGLRKKWQITDGFQRGASHLVCWEVCWMERWISERRKPSGLLGSPLCVGTMDFREAQAIWSVGKAPILESGWNHWSVFEVLWVDWFPWSGTSLLNQILWNCNGGLGSAHLMFDFLLSGWYDGSFGWCLERVDGAPELQLGCQIGFNFPTCSPCGYPK